MSDMQLMAAKEKIMGSLQDLKREFIRRQNEELETARNSGGLSPSEMQELEDWNASLVASLESLFHGTPGMIASLQAIRCNPVPFSVHGQSIRIMRNMDQFIIPLDAGPGKDWPVLYDAGDGGDWDIKGVNRLGRPPTHPPLPTDDSGEGGDWINRGSTARSLHGGQSLEGEIIGLIISRSRQR